MLTLDKIKLTVANKLFTKESIKYIRIGEDKLLTISKDKGKFINERLIEWQHSLVFPSNMNRQIKFEIFDEHKFGYNPEQLKNILHGKITNITESKDNSWEVYSFNDQKIGFLSAKITKSSGKAKKFSQRSLSLVNDYQENIKISQVNQYQQVTKIELRQQSQLQIRQSQLRQSQIPKSPVQITQSKISQTKIYQPKIIKSHIQQSQIHAQQSQFIDLYFSSIVVNLPQVKSKKVYVVITMGQNKIKTSSVKSRAGQLVFIQGYQFKIKPQINEAVFQIFVLNQSNNSQSLLASGSLNFKEKVVSRKIVLNNIIGEIVGQALIQTKAGKKGKLSNPLTRQQFNQSTLTHRQNDNLKDSKVTNKVNSPESVQIGLFSKSLHIRKNPSPSQQILNYSISYRSRPKRVSVLNKNNNILFPKEERFKSYSQKQSQICSYLQDHGLEFLNKHTEKHYYRGASIGYGNKVDFTKGKSVPGVGNYKIPSIWDRY